MSGDEIIVLIASGFLSLFAWFSWYVRPLFVKRLGAPSAGYSILFSMPLLCVAVLFVVLKVASAQDVRNDPLYLFFYLVVGTAWLAMGTWLLPLLGVSARDDVVERGNRGAAYAVGGALLAITLCFAGGNIGNGPGWWVVVFSAGLATGSLFLLWLLLHLLSGISDTVTIERDQAAGLRLAGFLVASGTILGRAVAGDWVSPGATLHDFAVTGWPTLLLLGAAVVLERYAHPTPARPAPPVLVYGALPALVYLAAAGLDLTLLGPVS